MTVSTQVFSNQYPGNGSTDEFDYDFTIYDSDELIVHLIDSDGVATLQELTADYSIDGVGEAGGGSIEFVTPPAAGVTVDIRPVYELLQTASITNQGRFLAETHERVFDRLTRFSQYLYRLAYQALRLPDKDELQSGELADVETRKGKYLFFDSVTGAVTYALNIVGTTLTQLIFNTFLADSDPFKRTAAEISAGVTPTDYSKLPYNRARYSTWADWKAACDQAEEEGVVNGDWVLTGDIELPKFCRFTGGELTGNFEVLYQCRQNGRVEGLHCYDFRLRGCYFCTIKDLYVENEAIVDGFNASFGTFWNEFIQWRVEVKLTVDITFFAVNLNMWRGGRIKYMHFTGNGSIHPSTHGHDNTWDGTDFTPNGVLQDDSAFEVNHMRSVYYETGATIRGNFNIIGYQGDDQHMPPVNRFAHILCSVGRNPRTSRDFFSASPINAAIGGSWDVLDSAGKPPSLAQALSAGVAVAADTTEPSGIGLRYEGTFSAAFSRFIVTISPNGSDRFGLLLYYKSTAAFETISSNDGTSDTSYTPEPVSLANDWKLLRISGPADTDGNTVVSFFAYGAVGGVGKFMAVGGFYGTGERACLAPSRPSTRVRYGSAAFDPAFLADGTGETTAVSVAGAPLGSLVHASFSNGLAGITVTAWMEAAGTANVRFQNETGGALNLNPGTLRVQAQEPYA